MNEPAIALFFQRECRPAPVSVGMFVIDAIPPLVGSLGNVFTLATVGGTVRIGRHLDFDYVPPQILSSLAVVEDSDSFGRNIFLDGNTFAESHSVDTNTLVGNFQHGLSMTYAGYRLAFTHVFLSKESDGHRLSDRYGTLTL